MQKITGLFFASLFFLAYSAGASDFDKEKRWAGQVVEAILDGDAIWLNDGGKEFLGIYTESEESSSRAVIIMHGTGIHPDWQQVVQPLRVGLTEHNWNTLSIQMPILANDAEYSDYAPLYDEVAPRVDAAIKYLRDKGIEDIVLIGHSQGSSMAAYYLSATKQKLAGFVAIGMGTFADDSRMDSISALKKIQIPVLDLYGKEDLDNIIASANDRAAAAKESGNESYVQVIIPGNHFFDDAEGALVSTVAEWLAARANP
jgi:pimeloyl-ACP methyl ester carboxylesterase